ncbi:MAG: DNA translocase FtsK [Fibrobacterota bacterium]
MTKNRKRPTIAERIVQSRNTERSVKKNSKKKRFDKGGDRSGLYGFLLICLSVLSVLSLVSNLLDPADNILGNYLGRGLARLLTGFAGNVPSLLFPVIFFLFGWNLALKKEAGHSYRQLFFAGLGFVELCVFLSIRNLGEGRSWEQFHTSGGLLGNFIVQNIMSLAFGTHKIGAALVMLLFMSATLIWGFRIDVQQLFLRIRAIAEYVFGGLFSGVRQIQLAYGAGNGDANATEKGRTVGARRRKNAADPSGNATAFTSDGMDRLPASATAEKTTNETEAEEFDLDNIEDNENLSINQSLKMRQDKRQRDFMKEFSDPVIREIAPEENARQKAEKTVASEDDVLDVVTEKAEERGSSKRRRQGRKSEMTETGADEASVAEGIDAEAEAIACSANASGEAGAEGEALPEPVEEVHYDEYVMPTLDLIQDRVAQKRVVSDEEIRANADRLIEKLKDYKIIGAISEVCPGPVVTRYELQLAPGTKVAKVESLSTDLAVAMAVSKIRISLVPGKSAIGIELPNPSRQTVYIKDIMTAPEFKAADDEIRLAVGKDIAGVPYTVNLTKMPHLLIAGTTGSGKSVCTNSFLASILATKRPDEVKLILIDPKVVEMTIYNGIPHLLSDVITTPKEAVSAMKWAVTEMNRRYNVVAAATCRNIAQFNEKVKDGSIQNTRIEDADKKRMPYIVIIIDELADLMLSVGKELEEEIVKVAQKSRAVGIHLILATQRPEAKVVTGLIKSNMPSRIALTVNSSMDSRIIMDDKGAEELLGMGDMLYKAVDMREPIRLHGCFIETFESEKLIEFARNQNVKKEKILSFEKEGKRCAAMLPEGSDPEIDELGEAGRVIVMRQIGSTSLIQRKMSVGYAKAGRLMDQLEDAGIVGPNIGSKACEVLITDVDSVDYYLAEYLKGTAINGAAS